MRILAIGAHPDDLEIHAFGTLALHAKRGDDVFVCGITNGDQGHMVIMPEELGQLRIQEAAKAAKTIGAQEYFNLGVHDMMVDGKDQEVIDKLIDVIRYTKPDYIISHRTDEYHNDHNETGVLAFNSSFTSSLPHYFTKEPCWGKVPSLYYMCSSSPNFHATDYVDISSVIELKLEALACHQSQVQWLMDHDKNDVLKRTRDFDAYNGTQCQVAYAEVFQRCMQSCRITPSRLLP